MLSVVLVAVVAVARAEMRVTTLKDPTVVHAFADDIEVRVGVIEGEATGRHFPRGADPELLQAACGTLACDGGVVGETHDAKRDVFVAVCKRTDEAQCPTSEVRPLSSSSNGDEDGATVAVCVPAPLESYMHWPSFENYLANFFQYYVQLGVSRFYTYSKREPDTWVIGTPGAELLTWLHVTFPTQGLFQEGRHWFAQDCLHRATAEGYSHALSLDFFEFLTFVNQTADLRAYANRTHRAYATDIVTFGSQAESFSRPCPSSSEEETENNSSRYDWASTAYHLPTLMGDEGKLFTGDSSSSEEEEEEPKRRLTDCDAPGFSLTPPSLVHCGGVRCELHEKEDHRYCSGECGQRKHLLYGPRALVANVNFAHVCKVSPRTRNRQRCHSLTESTDHAFLRNFRQERILGPRCPACNVSSGVAAEEN
mmetsp:Transcript_15316/g.46375  ORF Transcript_15316/g.46375 Transcript_15316/m.46375 type:complete len:424 (+) Transcript_15316:37-1308(+)